MYTQRSVRGVITISCLLLTLSLAAGNSFGSSPPEGSPAQSSVSVALHTRSDEALTTSRDQQTNWHPAKKGQQRLPGWQSTPATKSLGLVSRPTRWLIQRDGAIPLYNSRSSLSIQGRAPPVST